MNRTEAPGGWGWGARDWGQGARENEVGSKQKAEETGLGGLRLGAGHWGLWFAFFLVPTACWLSVPTAYCLLLSVLPQSPAPFLNASRFSEIAVDRS